MDDRALEPGSNRGGKRAHAVEVSILAPMDGRVRELLRLVTPPDRDALFGDECWSPVELVAVASVDGADVGLATLGRARVAGETYADIIAGWVLPEARGHGVGVALLLELAATSRERYGLAPHVEGVSPAGRRTIAAAIRAGARLQTDRRPFEV
jgi:GNAT superfamily N-acetyltransferase